MSPEAKFSLLLPSIGAPVLEGQFLDDASAISAASQNGGALLASGDEPDADAAQNTKLLRLGDCGVTVPLDSWVLKFFAGHSVHPPSGERHGERDKPRSLGFACNRRGILPFLEKSDDRPGSTALGRPSGASRGAGELSDARTYHLCRRVDKLAEAIRRPVLQFCYHGKIG